MAGRKATDKPAKYKAKNVNIEATYPHDPKREAAYHAVCARGLELKSYKVDLDELKMKYGKPKPPSGLQWPYTGYPKEDEEVSKWSKEKVIEEVQAIMDEHGIECLPSTKMIKERNQTLNVMIQKHCGGVGKLAEMMNVKTWQQAKIEEERAVRNSWEVEEMLQESKEMLQKLEENAQIEAKIEQQRKTFTELVRERKELISQPLPELQSPHENMRHHYNSLRDRIADLKKKLEVEEHRLEGFIFAAEVMGVEL